MPKARINVINIGSGLIWQLRTGMLFSELMVVWYLDNSWDYVFITFLFIFSTSTEKNMLRFLSTINKSSRYSFNLIKSHTQALCWHYLYSQQFTFDNMSWISNTGKFNVYSCRQAKEQVWNQWCFRGNRILQTFFEGQSCSVQTIRWCKSL